MEAFKETDNKSDNDVDTQTTVESQETMEEQGDNIVGV